MGDYRALQCFSLVSGTNTPQDSCILVDNNKKETSSFYVKGSKERQTLSLLATRSETSLFRGGP